MLLLCRTPNLLHIGRNPMAAVVVDYDGGKLRMGVKVSFYGSIVL